MKKTILILPIALAFVIGISLGTGVEAGGPFDCNGCIDKGDIGKKAVGKSEIKGNAVGGSEVKGTSKLIFGSCTINIPALGPWVARTTSNTCTAPQIKDGDIIVGNIIDVSGHPFNSCLAVTTADADNGSIQVVVGNICNTSFSAHILPFGYVGFRLT